jgi:hypothetical protein
MRLRIIVPLVAGFACLAGSAEAQSPYDYPWCAVHADKSGATSCYYSTYAECAATMQGIGGTCIRSPYYRGGPR